MEFKTREEVYDFLKKCTYLDEGSQENVMQIKKKNQYINYILAFQTQMMKMLS